MRKRGRFRERERGGREKERERETHTQGETDRQADRSRQKCTDKTEAREKIISQWIFVYISFSIQHEIP